MALRAPRVVLVVLALAATLGAAVPARADADLSCAVVPQLIERFLHKHIRHRELTPRIRERTAETFVRRLDPSRTLLLEKEVPEVKQQLAGMFEELEEGRCGVITELHRTVVKRQRRVEELIRKELSRDGYALDRDLELVVDPEKRGYPGTPLARNALYQRLAQFRLTNYLNGGTDLDEAREQVIHHYELRTKRAMEQKPEDLYASLLDAFAAALDPHSNYLSAELLEEFKISTTLSLEGIGAALSSRDGYSIVEQIIPGGAADRQGELQPKDKIIAVAQEDGEPVDVVDMDLADVVRLIRGEKGTEVRLTVLRQADKLEKLHVTIERDKIDLAEQAAKLRVEKVERGGEPLELGVIELSSFYGDRDPGARQSAADVARLLEQAREEEVDGLLLDLSRNGGGLLDQAVRIAGYFIRSGGIVAVKETGKPSQVLYDPGEEILYSGPLVVLTSRVSASASEILAGALKDYDRAVIVGDGHTFGKGTVQTVMPLAPGLGALKVTTGMFFRPGGLSTQHTGVLSHVILPPFFDTRDFGESAQRYALPGQKMQPFLRIDAETGRLKDAPWKLVTTEHVSELAERSGRRVRGSDEFADLAERLREDRERADNGVIRLSEMLNGEAGNGDGEAEEAAEDEDAAPPVNLPGVDDGSDEEQPPQVHEALEILADHVALLSG